MSSFQALGWWYAALSLDERAKLIDGPALSNLESDPLAERRFRRWLKTPAFQSKANLTNFLHCLQLSEVEFCALLGGAPRSGAEKLCLSQDWLEEFLSAFQNQESALSDYGTATDSLGFLQIVAPLVSKYRSELMNLVQSLNREFSNTINEPTVIASLLEGLLEQILSVITKTLVLEVNIARIEKALEGSNSTQRFESFQRLLETPVYRNAIFTRYPVLGRTCTRVCQQWLASSREFLQRLCHDRSLLHRTFGLSSTSLLVRSEIALSDSHYSGRRVIFASFECGQELVYKPRPLALAESFQAFIQWINEQGQEPRLRKLVIVNRQDYGWMEHVSAYECKSACDVQLFFRRQGALLAILYVLAGTDCHFQNIVASGPDPMLVDIETLFQPDTSTYDGSEAPDKAARAAISDSVMSVGLLPISGPNSDRSTDLSGLGATPFQETTLETTGLEANGTDQVRIARIAYRTGEIQNQATLRDSTVAVQDYLNDLDIGFSHTYDLLRRCRSALLSRDGPLSLFRRTPIRVLVRPTAAYAALLDESVHPKALQDATDREKVLAQLWWATEDQPVLKKVVFSEYKQMINGDVPYFASMPTSKDLISTDGTLVSSVFSESGMSVAKRRIRRMGDHDLDRQRWFVRASVSSSFESAKAPSSPPIIGGRTQEHSALDVCLSIGHSLERAAIQSEEGDVWLSMVGTARPTDAEIGYGIGVVGSDLYDGLAGIALYLSYLGHITSNQRFENLAQGALRTLDLRLAELVASMSVGAFDGLAGLVYVYSHIGSIQNDKKILDKAVGLLPIIAKRIGEDETLDVIGGAAGTVPCLLALHSQRPSSDALKLAISCGEHLIARLTVLTNLQTARGVGLRYQRGFSHGYSGVAWALLELGLIAADRRFVQASAEILAVERTLLDGGSWTDPDDRLNGQATWCHGAPGIALGRLSMLQKTNDVKIQGDAEAALKQTVLSRGPNSHCLCHGQLGNLETLLVAAQTYPNDPSWRASVQTRMHQIVEDIIDNGYRCSRPGYVEVPGLMTGLAGIGFELLRLAEPVRIPSVLLLQCPIASVANLSSAC